MWLRNSAVGSRGTAYADENQNTVARPLAAESNGHRSPEIRGALGSGLTIWTVYAGMRLIVSVQLAMPMSGG